MVGDTVQDKPVPKDAAMVEFILPVNADPADVTANFLDAKGKTICGAYYVYASKTASTQSGK